MLDAPRPEARDPRPEAGQPARRREIMTGASTGTTGTDLGSAAPVLAELHRRAARRGAARVAARDGGERSGPMGANAHGLGRYSLGIGDRFAHEAEAQLMAFVKAARLGVDVTPVWNKSNREHLVVGSEPAGAREAADAAVCAAGWRGTYFVDADHITATTLERFLDPCDFFTLDVAGSIGRPAADEAVEAFCARHPELAAGVKVDGIDALVSMSRETTVRVARHYLDAVKDAGQLYRLIVAHRGAGTFLTEVSMDETDAPQIPSELLVILAALADEGIPVRTIAPRFSGRFNTVSYTHLRAHETRHDLVCRLLL